MVSTSRPFPRVSASACAMRSRIAAEKRSRSPMKRTCTPRRLSSSTSRSSAFMNSFISAPTSSCGRPQFSLEKANSVSAGMPRSRQKSMQVLTARAPARWPTARGLRRRSAQRPLPSMMTARWRGSRGLVGDPAMAAATARPSDRHQLLLLGPDHLVDGLDRRVGDLLHLFLAAAHVVLGDFLLLQQLAELVVGIAADVADRDLGVLALGVHDLGELLSALLGQGGQVDADH